jgi:hypothetical protein
MSLIGSRADFKKKIYEHSVRCSECGRKGTEMLVSIRKGKVKKRICSEACRVAFDDRFWREKADRRP